jgi:hypothetical protein
MSEIPPNAEVSAEKILTPEQKELLETEIKALLDRLDYYKIANLWETLEEADKEFWQGFRNEGVQGKDRALARDHLRAFVEYLTELEQKKEAAQ